MGSFCIYPVSHECKDEKEDSKLESVIYIFGYILQDESYILLRVYNYRPWFILGLDPSITWNSYNIEVLTRQLNKVETVARSGRSCNVRPVKVSYQEGTSFFYKSDRKLPGLRVEFTNGWQANSFASAVTSMKFKVDKKEVAVIPLEYKESEFSNILKFHLDNNIRHGKWIRVNDAVEITTEHMKKSKIREFITNQDLIVPLSKEEEDDMPVVIPSILSFDIEQNSSVPLSFPTTFRPKDVIFMIGAVYRPAQFIYKDRENTEPILKKHMIVNGVCYDIQDTTMHLYSENGDVKRGEYKILHAFTKVFEMYYPAILLGHNIVSYDIDMMNNRGSLYKGFNWPMFSIVKDHNVLVKPDSFTSKAYSFMKNVTFTLPGTLVLDTCTIARREEKLRSYKLDVVAREFIEEGKVDLTPAEIFSLFQLASDIDNTVKDREAAMGKIAEYCIVDCTLPISLFLKRNYWISMCILSSIIYLPMRYIYSKGMLKRASSLMYTKAKADNVFMIPRKIKNNYKFEGGLVRSPDTGLYSGCIIVLDLNSLYPTVLVEKNICTSTLENKDDPEFSYPNIPEDKWNTFTFTRSELYNLMDTDEVIDADKIVNSIIGENDVVHIRWYKDKIGIVPKAQADLKAARSVTKNQLKFHQEGSIKYTELNGRQIALKLTANSLYGWLGFVPKKDTTEKVESYTDKMQKKYYGFSGFTSGSFNCIEAAICVTKRGREINNMITEYLEQQLGKSGIYKVIYGDTDSVFVNIKTVTEADTEYIIMPDESKLPLSAWKYVGKFLQDKVNSILPSPHVIEFEKAFRKILLKGKKNYIAIPYDDSILGVDPKYNPSINLDKYPVGFDINRINYETIKPYIRGLSLVRREDCIAVLTCIERILRQMLKNSSDLVTLLNVCREEIINFLKGPKLQDLVMTVQISKSYKKNSNHANKRFIDLQMSEYNRTYTPGERIEYIFVKTTGNAKVGDKMQTLDLYEEEGNEVDLEYYIEHRLANKLDQLLTMMFKMHKRSLSNFIDNINRRIVYTVDGQDSIELVKRYFCYYIREAKGDSERFTKLMPPFTPRQFESKYKGIILNRTRK